VGRERSAEVKTTIALKGVEQLDFTKNCINVQQEAEKDLMATLELGVLPSLFLRQREHEAA